MGTDILDYRKFLSKQLDKIDIGLQVIRLGPHRFTNLLNINRKNGKLICRNGFILNFNKTNYHDLRRLFYFSLLHGVLLSSEDRRGNWSYKKVSEKIVSSNDLIPNFIPSGVTIIPFL